MFYNFLPGTYSTPVEAAHAYDTKLQEIFVLYGNAKSVYGKGAFTPNFDNVSYARTNYVNICIIVYLEWK